MKVSINGVQQEESDYQGETLGAILDALAQKSPGSYIRRIWLDDKETAADDRDALQKNPSDIGVLEVELANLKDLVATNLANALDYLKKLIPGFEKAADFFRTGNEQEANKYYLQVLDGVEWFSQVVNIIMRPGESELPDADAENLQKRQEKLTGLMNQMLEANQNQDWVLLADILEYEMVPFYNDWEEILTKLENPH
jgi:molybdopterin converting factor small subunit